LEKTPDQQTRAESLKQLEMLHIEQINSCLRSGDYSRALELLRSEAAEFPNDNAELAELERLAQDGVKRNAEAQRLITESQELFAQQKSGEAIQLLRRAYELDKNNSLSRAILANALVEQAHAVVENDWREAETLAQQALDLNPSHPTAKSIRSLILDQKKTSPVEEWVAQARKLQSSGDLFAALSRVEEGLDIYPNDPKLLQTQDAILRDQNLRRRQARRRDLQDLRRMELEIDAAADDAAKKTLADRIQKVAANYWTDPEIISVANGFLQRLGLVSPASSTASPRGAVIFHVPPRSAPKPPLADSSPLPPSPPPPTAVTPGPFVPNLSIVPPSMVPPSNVPTTPPEPPLPPTQPAFAVPTAQPSAPAAKITPPSSRPKRPARSNSAMLLVAAAAIILVAVAATLFFERRHQSPPVAQTPPPAPVVASPAASTASTPAPESTPPAPPVSPNTTAGTLAATDQLDNDQPHNHQLHNDHLTNDPPPAEPAHNLGTLLIVAGQDGARVFLNGRLQPQLTQAGQLTLPNLPLKDYVVQVSKSGFQDPPQQRIRIREGQPARLVFDLQPTNLQPKNLQPKNLQPQPDRTITLATADAAREAAPRSGPPASNSELKITFSPSDATVALVKGDLLKIVSSGVPLNLAPGTYTLTARTAERFTRSSTLEVVAGQPKTLDLSLAPTGMSKWDDPAAWKHEADSFIRKGGDFVLYGVAPASGTFVFSAMPAKGRLLQWMLNYTDPKNYVLFQMDDKAFYRTVIRRGEKADEIIVPHKGDKKGFRTLQIRVSPTEIIHQIKDGDSWTVLDRWTQPGVNLSLGKFGFDLPGSDEVALSSFAHYADLNLR
jgi:tetratricopeptide (TPR) repeat protein